MAERLWDRISMSTPITRPRPIALHRLAENTSEPPWATPVSMMTSGFTR